jgi:hypothetical protein
MCQHKFILKLGDVLDGYDYNKMVLLDPAGLPFIQYDNPKGASGLSEKIYKKFGIETFHPDVRKHFEGTKNDFRTKLEAFYNIYVVNKNKTITIVKVVHAVGPNFNESIDDDALNILSLTEVYKNAFIAFLTSGLQIFRLVPISSGVFNTNRKTGQPIYNDVQLASLTMQSMMQGLKDAEELQKDKRKVKTIELYLNSEDMFDAFRTEIQRTQIPRIQARV